MHPIPAWNQNARFAHGVNRILQADGFSFRVDAEDFIVHPSVVLENTFAFSRRLSAVVWPPVTSGEFYHFTKRLPAESIIQSKRLRLYWVRRRVSEQEMGFALERFGYDHPLGEDPRTQEPRYYQSLAERRFYTSLTDVDLDEFEETAFWNKFTGLDGARFRLRIQAKTGFVRRMLYGAQLDRAASLMRKIQEMTRQTLGRPFHWDDGSVACAVALPSLFSPERETRIILTTGAELPVITDGSDKYVELRLGDNPEVGIRLDAVEVQSCTELPPLEGAIMLLKP